MTDHLPTQKVRVTTRVTRVEIQERTVEVPKDWNLDALSPEEKDRMTDALDRAYCVILEDRVADETVEKVEKLR